MARILALDYGLKRTGIATTDPLQIIASPLDTILTRDLKPFLDRYLAEEEVETVVVGLPVSLADEDTHGTRPVKNFIENFKKWHPATPIETVDERYTSKMAVEAMVKGGMKKKDRQKKENIDKISAAIILQSYLDERT